MILRKKEKPDWRPRGVSLRVRVQHVDLDNAAIEGIWTGDYAGYIYLRAARTILHNEVKPYRNDEVLIPKEKILFLEVIGSDAEVREHPAPGVS